MCRVGGVGGAHWSTQSKDNEDETATVKKRKKKKHSFNLVAVPKDVQSFIPVPNLDTEVKHWTAAVKIRIISSRCLFITRFDE